MTQKLKSAILAALGCCAFSAAAHATGFNLDKEHIPGQLIVKFKQAAAKSAVDGVLKSFGGKSLYTFRSSRAQLVSLSVKGDAALEQTAKALAANKAVQYVEANTILHAYETVPNDPSFGDLYGMKNTGANGGVAGADIHATEAWDITTGSKNVLVGIIDTGADYNHPDIKPNYWTNPGETGLDANGNDKATNGIDDDGNGFVDDWHGWDFANNDNDPMDDNEHGTHVAGTIGGHGNDGVGVVGVNWNVSIVSFKFLTADGSGTLADAVKAIEYATSLGVTLTSNSWGGGGFSDTMQEAIQEANQKGILFIAAAGNDGVNNDSSPHYPASYPLDNVISVAATDNKDGLASFSCYGPNTVHLGAPGVDILSSVPNGQYTKLSGTSMATPHVSGAAALVKAAYPGATAAQIKARLINTADPVASLAGKTISGGRLNVANALANDSVAPGAVSDLAVQQVATTAVTFQWTAAGDDGDQGVAKRYDVRYSASPIVDEAAWNAATRSNATVQFTDGASVRATVSGLAFNSNGYVAIKAIDKVGNVGPLSQSLPFSVRQVRRVYQNDAASMDGAHADGTWGLEADQARGKQVFSDSPSGSYPDNANSSLTLDPVTATDGQATLTFATSYELESGYDFGLVEVSKDGGATWVQIDKLTGSSGWTTKTYDLTGLLGGQTTFQVRFHITSDYSIDQNGWKLDAVGVYAPL